MWTLQIYKNTGGFINSAGYKHGMTLIHTFILRYVKVDKQTKIVIMNMEFQKIQN